MSLLIPISESAAIQALTALNYVIETYDPDQEGDINGAWYRKAQAARREIRRKFNAATSEEAS